MIILFRLFIWPGTQQAGPLCPWTRRRSWSLGRVRPRISSAGRSWSRWWAGVLDSGLLPERRSPSRLKSVHAVKSFKLHFKSQNKYFLSGLRFTTNYPVSYRINIPPGLLQTLYSPSLPATHPGCLPSLWPSSSVPGWGWSACAAGRRSGWSSTGWCLWQPSPGRCRSPARCEPGIGSSRVCRSSSPGISSLRSLSVSAGASPGRSSSSQHPLLYPWEKS